MRFLTMWKMNPDMVPKDPEERMKLWLSMMDMIKASLRSGEILDWGEFCDLSGGYTISEGDDMDHLIGLMRYTPYVIFDAKPVLSADQVIEAIRKAAS